MVFARVYPRESEKSTHDDALSFERALWALGALIRESRHTDPAQHDSPYYELDVEGLSEGTAVDVFMRMNDGDNFPHSRWFLFPPKSANGSNGNGVSLFTCSVCRCPTHRPTCYECATIEGGTGE